MQQVAARVRAGPSPEDPESPDYEAGLTDALTWFEADPDFTLRERIETELARHRKEGPEHRLCANGLLGLGPPDDYERAEQTRLAKEHEYAAVILERLLNPPKEAL